MNPELILSITTFLERAKASRFPGRVIPRKELLALNAKLGNIIPGWFIELLSTYPVAGVYMDLPSTEPEYEDCIDYSIQIADATGMYNEMVMAYPGIAMQTGGYFCFGLDAGGSGDPFFLSNSMSDNPPVYQVYHDVGETVEQIEKDGMIKIADSLSDLFSKAVPV